MSFATATAGGEAHIHDAIRLVAETVAVNGDQAGRMHQAVKLVSQTLEVTAANMGEGSQLTRTAEITVQKVRVIADHLSRVGADLEELQQYLQRLVTE
jgi:ABC-type transporter Mla subunit MlaD